MTPMTKPQTGWRRTKAARSAWQRTRAVHLAVYPECRVCGTEDDVVVHHLRYRGRRGESERPGDLMTLCRWHHDDLHRRYKRGMSLVDHSLDYVTTGRLIEAAIGYERTSPDVPVVDVPGSAAQSPQKRPAGPRRTAAAAGPHRATRGLAR